MERFINPRTIAIVGASTDFTKMGSLVTFNIRNGGYAGQVYPINPKAKTIHGYQAYPSLKDIPPPDLVSILVPRHIVPQVLKECVECKIKNIVLVTGGFRETGPAGEAAEVEVQRIAQQHGLNVAGPNCLGIAIPAIRLNMTTMPYMPPAGPVAFISQSGAFAAQNFLALERWGLGVSTVFSTGNEAVLTCTDYINICAKDPRTRVILLYVEGFRDGPRFLAAAKHITPHKPILLMKVGRTEDGQRAAESHTGAIAGKTDVFEGAMRQAGIILGKSLDDLFDWAMALAHQPLPAGPRVAILTNSGGPGVSLADVCAEEGLLIPPLPPGVQRKLQDILPPTAVTGNPVDSTFTINMRIFSQCADILLNLPYIDALLIHGFFGPDLIHQFQNNPDIPPEYFTTLHQEFSDATDALITTVDRYNKPVLISSTQDRADSGIRRLQEAGIPVYPMPERAAQTLGVMVRYSTWCNPQTRFFK